MSKELKQEFRVGNGIGVRSYCELTIQVYDRFESCFLFSIRL